MTPLPEEWSYTYADLLAWDGPGRYELYCGLPRAMSSPSVRHQEILLELTVQLHAYLRGKPCRVFPAPLDLRLFEKPGSAPEEVDTVLQPDLMVVCDPAKVDRRSVRGAPDLVIEILSDSTRRLDLLTKFRLYEQAGVKEYWVVDPEQCTVCVYRTEKGRYGPPTVYGKDGEVPVGVLAGCTVRLGEVFGE